jgi:hypothetical protein
MMTEQVIFLSLACLKLLSLILQLVWTILEA